MAKSAHNKNRIKLATAVETNRDKYVRCAHLMQLSKLGKAAVNSREAIEIEIECSQAEGGV